ncbi:transcription antitermination factor NusB [candidate division FCPU426 bacterium]|nr:transcription antitermination factor NusB [candidate division FCPU426 bacterium]
MLFQIDVGKLDAKEVVPYFLNIQKASAEVLQYAERLARGTMDEIYRIDKIIKEKAHHWELKRIVNVDRNILRLAVYELMYCQEVPKNVVINEAIELAKKYSTMESGGFINGILDQIECTQP